MTQSTALTNPTMKTAVTPTHPNSRPAIPQYRHGVATATAMLDAHFRRLEPELGKCLVGLIRQEIEAKLLLAFNDVRRAYRDELNASTLIP